MTARNGVAAILLSLVGFSCSDDLPTSRREPKLDGGVFIGDGGENPDALETPCPESEPKIGEGCPSGFVATNTCTYVVGMCMIPNGTVHNEYLTYCCTTGQWVGCGGNSVCDLYDGGVPPAIADSAPPADRPLDGGGDAPGDSPAGATPDGGVDGSDASSSD